MSDLNIKSTQESPENQASLDPSPKKRGEKDVPALADKWMTGEIMALLAAIPGPHVPKKRQTVIRLAFALANQQKVESVFDLPETCDRRIWYMKWQYIPEVKAAFEACYQRALEWSDGETAAIEAHYRRIRRRSVAEWAAQAPQALAAVMLGQEQRGSDRISAANALMGWADPQAAEMVRPASPAGSVEQTVNLVAGLSDEELDDELQRLEQRRAHALLPAAEGAGAAAAGEAAADGPAGQGGEQADT